MKSVQKETICVKTCILSCRISKLNCHRINKYKKMTYNIDCLLVTCLSPQNMDLYKDGLRKAWIVYIL